MIYDLSKPLDRDRFAAKVDQIWETCPIVEMTEKVYRSGNQNRYLHALIGAVALELGETIDYVKDSYYKTAANYSLFVLTKEDKVLNRAVTVLRSSADLTKDEMSMSIKRFKIWASKEGIYLPEPGDTERLKEIEYLITKNDKFLK